MDGFSFNVEYVKKRSRLKSLLAPFLILPIFVLFIFWNSPNMFSTFISNTAHIAGINSLDTHNYTNIIKTEDQLKSKLSDRITENENFIYHSYDLDRAHTNMPLNSGFNLHSIINKYVHGPYASEIKILLFVLAVCFIVWAFIMVSIFGFVSSMTIFFPLIFFLLFRKKYPKWFYTWNTEVLKYFTRVSCFFLLISPEFPDIDVSKQINIELTAHSNDLSRILPIIKWLLVLPHSIILIALFIILIVISFLTYLWTIITGNYPESVFAFSTGTMRRFLRGYSYSSIRISDEYPRFSFK